jgi:hypothetical protein
MTRHIISARQNGHLPPTWKTAHDDSVTATARALTAQAVALMPQLTDLARASYTVRWDVEDMIAAQNVSDEVANYTLDHLGLTALYDTMDKLLREGSVAIDCEMPWPSEWFVADQRARQSRRRAVNQ